MYLISLGWLLGLTLRVTAQCTSSGPNNASAASNNSLVGSIGWLSTSNIFASNNLRSSVTALSLFEQSFYLISNNYGFSVPASATICGLEVEIEKSASGLFQDVRDESIRLVKGGTIVGSNNANTAATWPTADTYFTHGSNTDLWGTTWTPAEVNATDFGVAISVKLGGISILPTAYIDHISMTVYYDTPLPVDLLYFKVHQTLPYKAVLTWSSQSEYNNELYIIERSTDGINWTERGRVPGAGFSEKPVCYTFSDENLFMIPTYYRLQQVDFDGSHRYTEIITFKPHAVEEGIFVYAYPNPTKHSIQLKTSEPLFKVDVYNPLGHLVKTYHPRCEPSATDTIYITPESERGLYIVKITDCHGGVSFIKVAVE